MTDVRTGNFKTMGDKINTYEMEQTYHEIELIKKKIASLPPTKEKQIRDLHRQILEREFAIVYQNKS